MVSICVTAYSNPAISSTVDTSSDAYKAGNIAGKVFVAVLAILIIKKLLFRK